MIRVRRANVLDLDWILDELRQFDQWANFRQSLFPADRGVAYGKLSAMLDLGHPVLIAEDHATLDQSGRGTPLGFIIGLIHEHFFNPDLRWATELFWWVSEQHRGTSAGAHLFIAFERWAETAGCHAIVMALEHESPIKPDSLVRRGYRPRESTFLKELV